MSHIMNGAAIGGFSILLAAAIRADDLSSVALYGFVALAGVAFSVLYKFILFKR